MGCKNRRVHNKTNAVHQQSDLAGGWRGGARLAGQRATHLQAFEAACRQDNRTAATAELSHHLVYFVLRHKTRHEKLKLPGPSDHFCFSGSLPKITATNLLSSWSLSQPMT